MAGVDVVPVVMVEELKQFLRIEGPDEDALLAWLLRAATEAVEANAGQLLIARTLTEEGAVQRGRMRLTRAPATAILGAVRATDGSGLEAVLLAPGWVQLAGVSEGERVRLTYRAGLGENWTGVPEPLRLSVVRTAAHFHAHRDGTNGDGVPPAAMRLLAPWRVRRLA